jgi:hypothetical protein
MGCDGRQRRMFRNLHDVCRHMLFAAASFPMADPAERDLDSLAADLGALCDTVRRDSLDGVYELLQRISVHLCCAPIPDVHWAVLEQSTVIDDLIFCIHPSMQLDFLTCASTAMAHCLPMPRGARVVCRPRWHRASSLWCLDRIPRDGSLQCANNHDILSVPGHHRAASQRC